MKRLTFLLLMALFLLPLLAGGAQTAQVRLTCGSLRFERGHSPSGAALDLTTIPPALNGELRPVFFPDYSYNSDFYLRNSLGAPAHGTLALTPPPDEDANTNAIPEFFEVAYGVVLTNVAGEFTSPAGDGFITAAWLRVAGSATGMCEMVFTYNVSSNVESFHCQFSLIEYSGTLTYSPGSNVVLSTVFLSQSGNVTHTLQGAMQFTKPVPNLSHQLTLQAGAWTHPLAPALNYPEFLLLRSNPSRPLGPTMFASAFIVDDGNPQTSAPDYTNWILMIDDSNDYDLDYLPDLADDLYFPPRPPHLTLTRDDTGFYYFILRGDLWRQHEIQQSDSLESPNWQTVASLTLMNDPQLLRAPPLTAPAVFWRAVAR